MMKGFVLDEFQRMVEHQYGLETYDQLVRSCQLASGGAYTTVGEYDHDELIQLVEALAGLTGRTVSTTYHEFGRSIFDSYFCRCPQMVPAFTSLKELLKNIEPAIHVEVRKLYPNATLPTFYFEEHSDDHWTVTYDSQRPFADFAEGILRAAVEHYEASVEMVREDLVEGMSARFNFYVSRNEPVGSCRTS